MVRGKVFTVIAGDSWNTIMYRTMENTNAVSSLFFVALIVLGEVGGANQILSIALEFFTDAKETGGRVCVLP